MNRKDRKFEDTEAYLALQNELELPEGFVFSYKSVDALIRKELGLNKVVFQGMIGEDSVSALFVNKEDDVEAGYPSYKDTLYLEALNVDEIKEGATDLQKQAQEAIAEAVDETIKTTEKHISKNQVLR